MFGGHRFNNDVRSGQGWIDMNRAIMVSNDTYFFMLAHDLGVDNIANFMKPLGFGQLTGIDIAGEARGILPSTEWKRKAYRKPEQQRWYEGETISLGIGQGYNSFTILQLAHATATLADNGVLMKPHLVKEIENPITKQQRLTVPSESGRLNVSQADIDVVKQGMENVTMNQSGTAYQVFRNAPYTSAGKTGTAQVFSLQGGKYKAHALAENLRDHALFIAFAPAEKPQIALALIVENGGWGAQAAGPIARRVLDYYLVDRLKPGAEQAAVSAAASATEDASAPEIGAPAEASGAAAASGAAPASAAPALPAAPQPVRVAAGFTPLPIPRAASAAEAASAASAAAATSNASGAAAAAPASSAVPASGAAARPMPASAAARGKTNKLRQPVGPDAPAAIDAVNGGTASADGASDAGATRPAPVSVPRHFGPGPHRPRRPASAPDAATLAPPPKPATGGIDE
jgi:penicillin-binding protein 2